MDGFQREVGEWADSTFPQSDGPSILRHLREEVGELQEIVNEAATEFDTRFKTHAAIMGEAGDCLLLLLHLSHKLGFDLLAAAQLKHEVNTRRTWETDDDGKGYWKHVAEGA